MPWTSARRSLRGACVPALLAIACVFALLPVTPASAAEVAVSGPHDDAQAAMLVDTVALFEARLPRVGGCLGAVDFRFEDLAGRVGEYRVREATIALDVGRSPARTRYAVVHELAHQAMFRCGMVHDAAFKAAFYGAQGLPADRSWFAAAGGWASVPAEQLAEAVVAVVLGSHDGSAPVAADGIAVVRAWAHGAPYPVPTVAAPASTPAPAAPSATRTAPAPTSADTAASPSRERADGSVVEAPSPAHVPVADERSMSPSLSGPLGLHIGRIVAARTARPIRSPELL